MASDNMIDIILSRIEDGIIKGIVQNSFTTLVSEFDLALKGAAIMAILFIAVRLLVPGRGFDFGTAAYRAAMVVVVWQFLHSWPTFSILIYDVMMYGPDQIAQALTKAMTGKTVSTFAGLSDLWDGVIDVMAFLWSKVGLTGGYEWILVIIFYFLASFALFIVSLSYIIIAKLGLGIMLTIAPIPIALLMFATTAGVFTQWLRWVVALAFLTVMIVAALVFVLSIIANDVNDAASGKVPLKFGVMMGNILVMGVSSFLFIQIMKFAQSMGTGLNLDPQKMHTTVRNVVTMPFRRKG